MSATSHAMGDLIAQMQQLSLCYAWHHTGPKPRWHSICS